MRRSAGIRHIGLFGAADGAYRFTEIGVED